MGIYYEWVGTPILATGVIRKVKPEHIHWTTAIWKQSTQFKTRKPTRAFEFEIRKRNTPQNEKRQIGTRKSENKNPEHQICKSNKQKTNNLTLDNWTLKINYLKIENEQLSQPPKGNKYNSEVRSLKTKQLNMEVEKQNKPKQEFENWTIEHGKSTIWNPKASNCVFRNWSAKKGAS